MTSLQIPLVYYCVSLTFLLKTRNAIVTLFSDLAIVDVSNDRHEFKICAIVIFGE